MEHQEQLKFLKQDFKNLQEKLQHIEVTLGRIELDKPKRRDSIMSEDEDKVFPVENIEELQILEKKLRKEKEFRRSLVV